MKSSLENPPIKINLSSAKITAERISGVYACAAN
jgi:hypothetical protein